MGVSVTNGGVFPWSSIDCISNVTERDSGNISTQLTDSAFVEINLDRPLENVPVPTFTNRFLTYLYWGQLVETFTKKSELLEILANKCSISPELQSDVLFLQTTFCERLEIIC